MAERSKAADSKSAILFLRYRGFESLSLRFLRKDVREVEGARLEVVYGQKPSGVRIPLFPILLLWRKREVGLEYLLSPQQL